MSDVSQVIAQMAAVGMPPLPANHPVMDGKYKRFGPQKKGWYILREMTLRSGRRVVTGAFGIFQGEQRNTVPVTMDMTDMSDDDRADLSRKQREYEVKEAADKQRAQELAKNRGRDQWNKAKNEALAHPYLARKQITAEGVRVSIDGKLLIPMIRADGQFVGLQKIDAAGVKLFNKDADAIGAAHILGQLNGAPIIALGEGYATCRTVRMAFENMPVAIAFNAGNLMHVALWLRRLHPDAHLLFLVDDDYQVTHRLIERLREEFQVSVLVPIDGSTHHVAADDAEIVAVTATWRRDAGGIEYIEADVRKGRQVRMLTFRNAGLASCTAAAAKVGNASLVMPIFAARGDNKWSDFNDLQVQESFESVASQIGFALSAAQQPVIVSSDLDLPAPLHLDSLPAADAPRTDSPPPPSAKQPGSEDADAIDPRLAAVLEARYGDSDANEPSGEPFGGGAGDVSKGRKDRPKKVYGAEHWDRVEYVLRNFVLIYGEDLVWDESQRMLMKISSMRTIVAENDVMKFWGGEARKWALKKNIVFDPQETPSPARSGATATINLFSGWKMQPKVGKFEKIQTLLYHLCDGKDDLMEWVERWIAYPLRNRGAKMETSIIMHGDEGSGKNFYFEKVIKKIYGEYGYVIGNAQLESQFNDWAGMKLFMVADEVVTRSELKHMKGKLKYLVSGDMIIINPKGLPEHGEANHMNFVFLSNELQPLALDKTDRRYLVIWTPPALSREFYIGVADEIKNGGIEAYYHHLMHDIDMGDFDEHTKPLYTDAKDELIEKSLTPAERFYRDWSRGFLPLPFITCGATQLFDAFKVWCEKSGEGRYISQTVFSPTVLRYAGDAMEKSVIKYEYGHVVKQRNVFLVGDRPEGKTLANWAADAAALFETSLMAYRSRASANVEG